MAGGREGSDNMHRRKLKPNKKSEDFVATSDVEDDDFYVGCKVEALHMKQGLLCSHASCIVHRASINLKKQRKGFSHYHLLGAALDPNVKLMVFTNASKEEVWKFSIKRSSTVLSTMKMFLRIPEVLH